MNMQNTPVMAPPAPKRLEEMRLPVVMMRDILLKTMFRKNLDMVSELSPRHLPAASPSRRSWSTSRREQS